MSRSFLTLIISVSFLFALGLVMIFDTTSAEVLDRFLDKSIHHAVIKQLLYAMLGMIGACVVWFVGYETLIRLSGPLLVFATCSLVLVFIPGIGLQLNGAHRWLNIFGNSLQPSEFVKYLLPLYTLHCVTAKGWMEQLTFRKFLMLIAKLAIPMGLILIEPDNGAVAIIMSTLIVLFAITRVRWVYWALPLLCLGVLGGLAATQMPHVGDRLKVYLDPSYDLLGKGHQPYQARIAAGSGGFWGKGLGESVQKLEYLPEARSDYIAAIFAEECGFIGILGLIVLYLCIACSGFSIASKIQDPIGSYIASIFTFLICFQAFLHLGVTSGLLPSKGTNLPFFSQGGSSLLANMMALTVILNIATHANKEVQTKRTG